MCIVPKLERATLSWHTLAAGAMLLLSGCTALKTLKLPMGDVRPQRLERNDDVAGSYKIRRNDAQFAVATELWQKDDGPACEAALMTILERDPRHRDARRLLADLYVEREQLPAARGQLDQLLHHYPDDAQAHHSLGMVLESLGEPEQALKHLDRAAELEPANELYALSRQTLLESPSKVAHANQPQNAPRKSSTKPVSVHPAD